MSNGFWQHHYHSVGRLLKALLGVFVDRRTALVLGIFCRLHYCAWATQKSWRMAQVHANDGVYSYIFPHFPNSHVSEAQQPAQSFWKEGKYHPFIGAARPAGSSAEGGRRHCSGVLKVDVRPQWTVGAFVLSIILVFLPAHMSNQTWMRCIVVGQLVEAFTVLAGQFCSRWSFESWLFCPSFWLA